MKMGLLVHCAHILLLNVAVGLDFQQGAKTHGQSVFLRKRNFETGTNIEKRSLPEWLAPSKHEIHRRSAEGDTCKAIQGYDTKLADNTHSVSYPHRSCYTFHSTGATIASLSNDNAISKPLSN